MVTIVLPDDLLAMELPETSVVVRASCDQISGVGTESAVPDPALVASQSTFESEGNRLCRIFTILRCHFINVLDLPDLGGVVSTAGR